VFDCKGWTLLALKEKYLRVVSIQIILQKYTCQLRATTFWSSVLLFYSLLLASCKTKTVLTKKFSEIFLIL